MSELRFVAQDAEELLKALQDFHDAVSDEWSQVLNKWSNLQSEWSDRHFDEFEPIFEQFASTYDSAEKESDKYIGFVKRAIDINKDIEDKLRGGPAGM